MVRQQVLLDDMDFQLAETPVERDLLFLGDVLIAEKDDDVVVEMPLQLGKGRVVDRPGQIEDDLGAARGAGFTDRDRLRIRHRHRPLDVQLSFARKRRSSATRPFGLSPCTVCPAPGILTKRAFGRRDARRSASSSWNTSLSPPRTTSVGQAIADSPSASRARSARWVSWFNR